MPNLIPLNSIRRTPQVAIPRNNGLKNTIVVHNNNFEDDHDYLLDVRNLTEILFQIQNIGDTNGLSYEIYGSIDESADAPPFSLTEWSLLENAFGDISKGDNDLVISKLSLYWILIRLKRQTSSLDTMARIRTTSGVIG